MGEMSDVVKEAKAAAKKAVEESESSGDGGGMSLLEELSMSGNGGGDSSALADELEKVQNRMADLVVKAEYQKEMKKMKSMLTKESSSMNDKIDEVTDRLTKTVAEVDLRTKTVEGLLAEASA